MTDFKVYEAELDDSMDATNTLMNNWPPSMATNGRYVDGEDDLFDRDDELDGIFNGDGSETREEIQVGFETLSLAPNFCADPEELDRIFSIESWNSLDREEQQRLMSYLPKFDKKDDVTKTIGMLLTGKNFRFGNPVEKFKSDLISGKLSPDSVKMTKVLQKANFRRYKAKQLNYNYTLLRDILSSRKKLLESRTSQPVKTPLAVLRMKRKSVKTRSDFDDRVAKRYFKELNVMRQGEGGENRDSSEDENYPNGPPSKQSVALKREVSLLDSDYWQSLQNGKSKTIATSKIKMEPIAKKEPDQLTPDKSITLERTKKNSGSKEITTVKTEPPIFGSPKSTIPYPFPVIPKLENLDQDNDLKPVPSSLLNNSFESLLPKVPVTNFQPLPNLLLSPPPTMSPAKISPSKVSPSNLLPMKLSDHAIRKPGAEISILKPTGASRQLSLSPPKVPRKAVNDLEVIEEAVANIPGMDLGDTLVEDFDLDFCFDSVELSSSPHKSHNRSSDSVGMMSPPVSNIDRNMGDSDAHFSCFFSLLRDKFRSSLDYKMPVQDLEDAVADWESQGYEQISWFSFSSSWTNETRSAVAFLSNSQPQLAPANFVPFLNCCDRANQIFQWIGTGRDADLQLQSVCHWWFERRQLCFLHEETATLKQADAITAIETVPATSQQQQQLQQQPSSLVNDFHTQERERMYNPSQSFTYRFADFSVTVGPIRAAGGTLSTTPCKGKSHPLLALDRPAYITLIVIVRDAVARLRNGEGTRQRICELVKESQFINQEASKEEKLLTSAVSGALDRLQGEADPCCKYDTSKKTWQYLHQGRTAQDFARLHTEQLASAKSSKGKKQRKASESCGAIPSPIVESLTTATTTTAAASGVKMFASNPEDSVLNAVNSILPTEPLQRSELPPASIQLASRSAPPPSVPTSLLSSALASPVILPNFPSEPLPPVSILQTAPVSSLPPASVMQTAPLSVANSSTPVSVMQAAQVLPGTPVPVTQASVQMIQVMTSQGLKTFRLTSNKTCEPTTSLANPDPILKIQQPLPPQPHQQQSQQSVQAHVQPSLLRPKLSDEIKKLANLQPQQQQTMTRLISTTSLPEPQQSLLKVTKSEGSVLTSGTSQQAQHQQPKQQQQQLQSVQRVFVKDSEGKPVQISSEAFQKLLAARNARSGVGQTIIGGQSGQSNLIRVQRPSGQFTSQIQSGDGSIVQVVQRPVVAAPINPEGGQRQTLVKIQGNMGNLSQQQLQTVQLLSSSGASSGSGVRLIQTSQQQQQGSPMVLPSRIVVSSSNATPSTITATPSSIVSIGGRQYILANSQTRPQQTTVIQQQARVQQHSQVVQQQQQQSHVAQQQQQQQQSRLVQVSSTAPSAGTGNHYIVQSSTGKQIVLTHEQLQQFQSLQNIRIVQAAPQQQQQQQQPPPK